MDRRTKGRERVKKKIRLTALLLTLALLLSGCAGQAAAFESPVSSPLLKGYTLGLS